MQKVPTALKFVGTISLGLLTGLSYTLSTITLPTLLTLPSANQAARAFTTLVGRVRTQTQCLATLSAVSFFTAYLFSPRAQRHPYLLWTTLFVTSSSAVDFLMRPAVAKVVASTTSGAGPTGPAATGTARDGRIDALKSQAKGKARQMDASYEVVPPQAALGTDLAALDSHSEEGTNASVSGTGSGDEPEEDVDAILAGAGGNPVGMNGEDVRRAMEGFTLRQVVRTGLAGVALAMSVVGIWGDGAVESVVFVEM